MWDYKVIAGRYSLDGADVVVENPLGRGTLQRVLDHYGNEGFEMVSSHYDGINREIVVLMKRPRGGVPSVAAPMVAGAAAAADMPASRRGGAAPAAAARGGGGGGGGRRSKADLDRLARDE